MIFQLIDRLAGWWMDWRLWRHASKDPDCQEIMLHKLECTQEGVELIAEHPHLYLLADEASRLLDKAKAGNYLQFDILPRPDRGLKPVRFTVQWAHGLSPAEKAARLAKENAELKGRVQALEFTRDQLLRIMNINP